MLKGIVCPVCEGFKRLRGIRKVGIRKEEYEVACWACRGTGNVQYSEDKRPGHLKTIFPEDVDGP